jgi:hypothetical protein
MKVKIIGYVPLDEDGETYRPTLGTGWREKRKPTTVYQTKARAENYSPVKQARQVLMVLDDVTEEDITTGFPV